MGRRRLSRSAGGSFAESGRAYDVVADRFHALGQVALLRREGGDDLILAVPGALPTAGAKPWIPIGLFVATLLSVAWTGALAEQGFGGSLNLLSGLPFAVSLMGILLTHELGHYTVARLLGVPA